MIEADLAAAEHAAAVHAEFADHDRRAEHVEKVGVLVLPVGEISQAS